VGGTFYDRINHWTSLYKQFSADKNLALIIGIGDSFLRDAGSERIKKRILECFEVCKPGGRFMFYFCDLTTTTPPANIRYAIEIIKQYGTY
jgi:uroporphyrinogen-III decarboxylase